MADEQDGSLKEVAITLSGGTEKTKVIQNTGLLNLISTISSEALSQLAYNRF